MTVTTAPAPSAAVLPFVEQSAGRFVQADLMKEAVSLAMASGLGLILSGPGGHAKTDFLSAVFGSISGAEVFVKTLTSGTTVDDLYGGVDIAALNRAEDPCLQFNVGHSFLTSPFVWFEEGLDGPPRVTGSLKDTLTARRLRNGKQWADMMARLVVITTNQSPLEIAGRGRDVAALIERFPIQLEVKWNSYEAEDFWTLFNAVEQEFEPAEALVSLQDIIDLQERAAKVRIGPLTRRVLSGVVAELRMLHVTISPRTAVYAMRLVKAAAAIAGRNEAVPADIMSVAFLPGCSERREAIAGFIGDMESHYEPHVKADELRKAHQLLVQEFGNADDWAALTEVRAMVEAARSEARGLTGDLSLKDTITTLWDDFDYLLMEVDDKISKSPDALKASGEVLRAFEHDASVLRGRLRSQDVEAVESAQQKLLQLEVRILDYTSHPLLADRHKDLRSGVASLLAQFEAKLRGMK